MVTLRITRGAVFFHRRLDLRILRGDGRQQRQVTVDTVGFSGFLHVRNLQE